jgi:3-oxoadipate enol-lactonase
VVDGARLACTVDGPAHAPVPVLSNSPGSVASCAALRDADLRDQVERIRVPCLVVAGEQDEATPPGQARDLQSAIPDSRLVVLSGAAGHLSNMEQPDEFTRPVLAFVTGRQGEEL